MANCKICGHPVTTGVVVHPECLPGWVRLAEHKPDNFVSVLGHMPGMAPFPAVREAYNTAECPEGELFYPALGSFEETDMWCEMPEVTT